MKKIYFSKLKGYRTVLVNAGLAAMPILEMSEVLDILPDHYEAPYAIFIAVINLYLRSITTTPFGARNE
ncbi:hypothetical protein [Lentilitoribacter sp. Alg239-R112]|uniref:hypothetical protein n=1 Tax=Lentilitoribacter sp. Alg239-R112 TaxID=2305987 RepID=UPI0013A6C0AB|nr:hypothetical protein [Lentilitoribacter sp. Alg239-R112]